MPTLSYTTLPMKSEPAPPTSVGVMKSPSVSENVKIEPAAIPGRINGNSTERNVRQLRAPRSADASMKESGTRSIAAHTGRIMKGSQM